MVHLLRIATGMRVRCLALSLLLGAASLSTACGSPMNHEAESSADIVSEMQYRLPGFEETLLAADRAGTMALVKLGASTTVEPVDGTFGSYVVAGRSFERSFWVLSSGGKLGVIDPVAARLDRVVDVSVPEPSDLEIESADAAWVAGAGRIDRVATTGDILDTIDLSAHAISGGVVRSQTMTRVGDHLFVQLARRTASGGEARGALAIVDLPSRRLEKVLDLVVPTEDGSGTEEGFNPGGAMLVDEAHGKLLLTARGFRPSNTGMVLRIDLARLELDPWSFHADSGFQGGLALGAHADELFIAYHTSTPVASTHFFDYRVGDDGALVREHPGALLDAFEVIDTYPVNASRSLFAVPVRCSLGFCLGGKGVTFIDMKTSEVYPRLSATDLGLTPSFVLFL